MSNSTSGPSQHPDPGAKPATVRIGLVSISDRASAGVYEDKGIPGLEQWLSRALLTPWTPVVRLIPDERATIEATLIDLVDREGCSLVLTTGGTGPAPRDVTPDATLAVADREMPGFGEIFRYLSFAEDIGPAAMLSRAAAGVVGALTNDSGPILLVFATFATGWLAAYLHGGRPYRAEPVDPLG